MEDSIERRCKWKEPETINVDIEREYSATLTAGRVSETDEIEVDENEFKATFSIGNDMGDLEVTYAGRVEDGKLSGTISASMFGTESKLVGKLKVVETDRQEKATNGN